MRIWILLVVFVLALLAGCTPARKAIPFEWGLAPGVAHTAATFHAEAIQGHVFQVAGTSMFPFLQAGDWIVVKPTRYEDLKAGELAAYQARWRPTDADPVVHWAAVRSGDEWVMDGQANRYYEKGDSGRMGKKEFRGTVVAVYTTRKK